jgi:hypothetical protein
MNITTISESDLEKSSLSEALFYQHIRQHTESSMECLANLVLDEKISYEEFSTQTRFTSFIVNFLSGIYRSCSRMTNSKEQTFIEIKKAINEFEIISKEDDYGS